MEENFNIHLGKKLRMRRLSLGLTQTKVAQAINVTFQQIQKYEKGTNGVSSNRLMQLSQFLKVPIIYFFEDYKEFKDVKADLKTWPKRSDEVQGLVHAGFAEALDKVWKDLEPFVDECVKLHKIKQVIFTGHSLGGALAVVAAARSKYIGEVYTYGQPRVGNRKYSKQVKSKVYRFVNNNDVVPRVPPPLVFGHQGIKFHIVNDKLITPTGNWNEFLTTMKVRLINMFKFRYFRSLVADHDISSYHKLLKSIKF